MCESLHFFFISCLPRAPVKIVKTSNWRFLLHHFSGFSIRCIFFTYLFGFDTHFSSPEFSGKKYVFRCRPQHVSWRFIHLIALAPQFYSWKESRLGMFSTASRFNYLRSRNLIFRSDRRVAYYHPAQLPAITSAD